MSVRFGLHVKKPLFLIAWLNNDVSHDDDNDNAFCRHALDLYKGYMR